MMVAILRRQAAHLRWLTLLVCILVISSGPLTYAPQVTVNATALPAPTVSLRVMSWNAYFRNPNHADFLRTVETIQPDLIAIQEYSEQLATVVQTNLHERYPYQELYPANSPAGMAVLSRYPLLTTTIPDFDRVQGCNCQVITLDLAGTSITVINAHPWPPDFAFTWPTHWSNLLGLDTANQDPIFDALLRQIDQVTGPLLVVGDLNTMPFQPNVGRLAAILTDAFVEAGSGLGYTFPLDGKDYNLPPVPFMRIDYIFHNAAWTATKFEVGTIAGSDHRYVVADLIH